MRWRDAMQCLMLAAMAAYMVSVGNHQRWVDPNFATHPMFQVCGVVCAHRGGQGGQQGAEGEGQNWLW